MAPCMCINVPPPVLQAPFKQQGWARFHTCCQLFVDFPCAYSLLTFQGYALATTVHQPLTFMVCYIFSFLILADFLNFKRFSVHGQLAESRDQSTQLHQRGDSLKDLHVCHANLLWALVWQNKWLVKPTYHFFVPIHADRRLVH